MDLTEQEALFLRRRSRRIGIWPPVGASVLLGLVAFCGWLVWKQPLLIDAPGVWARLERHAISSSTLAMMAAMLPVVVALCLLLAAALLGFVFVAFSNEKKHIETIRRLTGSAE